MSVCDHLHEAAGDDAQAQPHSTGNEMEEEIQRLSQRMANDVSRDRRRALSQVAKKGAVAISLTVGILSVLTAVAFTVVNIANPSLLGPGGQGISPEERSLGAQRLAQEAVSRVDRHMNATGRFPASAEAMGLSPLDGVTVRMIGSDRYEITVQHGREVVRLERTVLRRTGGK